MLVVRKALLGRRNRASRAREQPRAEFVFEQLDLLADGGLVQVQLHRTDRCGSAPAGQSGGVEIKDSDRCPSSSRPPRCRQSIGRHGMLQC